MKDLPKEQTAFFFLYLGKQLAEGGWDK